MYIDGFWFVGFSLVSVKLYIVRQMEVFTVLVVWEEISYMDTLEELKYYCEEPKPVGALMLTGEWGCGKTYLIDNILSPQLNESHIMIRISLFGMETVDDLKNEMKRKWFYALAEEKQPVSGLGKKLDECGNRLKKFANNGKDLLPEPFKSIASGVLSLDVLDFVKIEPYMGKKKVILVFDDLERANISTGDLLGCINDYCENLHINTIVVANEEKIKSDDSDKIKYSEIKEKIIQRTIRYRPDFRAIVSVVINDIANDMPNYEKFLHTQKESIITIFSGQIADETLLDELSRRKLSGNSMEDIEDEKQKITDLLKRRPHNIRSLKYALQDFKRVFQQLDEKKIGNKEKWLFSYLAYVLSFRATLVSEDARYGGLFSGQRISILYPGFYDARYITDGIQQWICHGEWDQKEIDSELEAILEREKAITPEDKVRTNRLLELDEKDIQDGYAGFLKKAYNGEISLDDYVLFLMNRCWGRQYEIPLPDIKWAEIYKGIEKKKDELIQEGEEQPRHRVIISDNDKSYFSPEEWAAYEKIKNFLDNKVLIFERNKKLYLDIIKKEPTTAFIQIQNKCFDRFDEEMASITAERFEKASNAEKNQIPNWFKDMWKVKIWSQDYKIKSEQNGLTKLKEQLQKLLEKYSQDERRISVIHTKKFIKVVSDLCDEQEKRIREEEE